MLPAPTPAISPINPGTLQHSPLEGIHLQTIDGASQRVSTPKTRNMLKQVQMARSEASLSSAELDNHLETPGLNMSPPKIVHEPTPARNPTSIKSVPEMVLPISWPSSSSGIHIKTGEQSKKTILSTREPPKGNSILELSLLAELSQLPFWNIGMSRSHLLERWKSALWKEQQAQLSTYLCPRQLPHCWSPQPSLCPQLGLPQLVLPQCIPPMTRFHHLAL